jgi:hypothetical protein
MDGATPSQLSIEEQPVKTPPLFPQAQRDMVQAFVFIDDLFTWLFTLELAINLFANWFTVRNPQTETRDPNPDT